MSENDKRGRTDPSTGVVVKAKPKTRKPSMYKVLLLNDDYTPMEFVVHVLERFFAKTREEATRIMLHVHRRGVGVCGVYTFEVAETKVTQVIDFARRHEHPLQCTLEKDGYLPMLSPNLEQTLHRALAHANSRRHEFATLEHLLLALTEDQDALAVLRACGVDTERLRRELTEYIENELTNLTTGHIDDAKPTA